MRPGVAAAGDCVSGGSSVRDKNTRRGPLQPNPVRTRHAARATVSGIRGCQTSVGVVRTVEVRRRTCRTRAPAARAEGHRLDVLAAVGLRSGDEGDLSRGLRP